MDHLVIWNFDDLISTLSVEGPHDGASGAFADL